MLNRRLEIDNNIRTDVSIECWVTAEINDLGLLCTTHSLLGFALQKGTKAYKECAASFDGLLPGSPMQLEFTWDDGKDWIRARLLTDRPPEPESKFVHRVEMANIDERREDLDLSILFVEGKFWSTQNEQFNHLVSTPPLIGLFNAWSSGRSSIPMLKNYSLSFKEKPSVTGAWRSRPRFEFERIVDWNIHLVSDFRPDDDEASDIL